MSIAQSLPDIHPDFMQKCPLCGRSNRMVVQGVYVLGNKADKHPDMGYSFCNYRNIFYTKKSNVTESHDYLPKWGKKVTLPDPYFAWPDPYQFLGWNVRVYEILWDMQEYCIELESQGYKIIKAWRDMDIQSITPQCFHVEVEYATTS